MKDELNQINITNEGKSSEYGEHIRKFDNDDPRFIKEDALSGQAESFRAQESFETEPSSRTEIPGEIGGEDLSSAASSAASSSVGSVASSIGSSFGALAGVMATSVVAAVVVVVAFISSLVIDLSLVMSDMYSLVFEVQMSGEQEEDFVDPILAVLTGEDGTYQEQEVKADTLYLTFGDLQPGKEYTVRIKNSEKIFVEKSYFTAKTAVDRGSISAESKGGEVTVKVQSATLKAGEYYTLVAKDEQGNVVFTKDGVDPDAEYNFALPEAQNLYFSLSVGGKAFAVSQLEIEQQPKVEPQPAVHTHTYGELIPAVAPMCSTSGMAAHYYCEECGKYFDENKTETTEEALTIPATGHDYAFDSFVWTDDYGIARAKFVCGNNPKHWYWEEAVVTSEVLSVCSCDEDGVVLYTATYGEYSDQQRSVEPAFGHLYGNPEFIWTKAESGYEATAVFTCLRNSAHEERVTAEVVYADGVYNATATLDGAEYHDSFEPMRTMTFGTDDSRLYVTPIGYARTYSDTLPNDASLARYVTSENNIIKVTGNYDSGVNPINFYQIDADVQESDVYILFEDLTVDTSCYYDGAVVRLGAVNTLNVHLAFKGSTTLLSGSNPIFYSEGGVVNVYLYIFEGDEAQQVAWDFDSYSGSLFDCDSGEIHVYIWDSHDPTSGDQWAELTSDHKRKPSAPAGSGVASVDDGYVRVYADGYTDANGEYSFENTSTSNYVISGECTGDNPLTINTSNMDGSSAGVQKVTYYLTFDNLNLTASAWASAFNIKTYCDLELHIVYKGAVSITGYNHPAFSLEGGYDIMIYMDPYDSASTFNYGRQYGSSPKLYGSGDNPYSGNVRFVLDGTEVDRDGNVL